MSSPVKLIPLGMGVQFVEFKQHEDHRGSLSEPWNLEQFRLQGLPFEIRQTSLSRSLPGVLRGLHFQSPPQLKLVTLIEGKTFHAAVDLRPDSASFGQHVTAELSALVARSLLIPEGFAHGFLALESSILCYHITEVHRPESEWSVLWNDSALGIRWPLQGQPIISERDQQASALSEIPPAALEGLRNLEPVLTGT